VKFPVPLPGACAESPVPSQPEQTRVSALEAEESRKKKKKALFGFATGFIWNADFSLQGHEQKPTGLVSYYYCPNSAQLFL